MESAKNIAQIALAALEDKKAEDIHIIDISNVSVIADYFIICNGNSSTQIQALIDNVEESMHKIGIHPKQEGYRSANWILLDCGDVIVHVFDKENRLFYDLERMWMDGKRIEIADLK